jgi:hypothetical protein
VASMVGGVFFIMGGQHLAEDDFWIAQEMKARKGQVVELEWEKKSRINFHARREEALVVLDLLKHDLGGNIDCLTNGELKSLFKWKGIPA